MSLTKFEATGFAELSGRGKIVERAKHIANDLYLVEFLDGQRLYAFLPPQPGWMELQPGTEVIVGARVTINFFGPSPDPNQPGG